MSMAEKEPQSIVASALDTLFGLKARAPDLQETQEKRLLEIEQSIIDSEYRIGKIEERRTQKIFSNNEANRKVQIEMDIINSNVKEIEDIGQSIK